MKLTFVAEFDPAVYRQYGIYDRDCLLVLRCEPMFWENVKRELGRFVKRNAKRVESGKDPMRLEVDIEADFRSRTLSQNAWLWAMHTLEANFLNGHRSAWTDNQGIKWREVESITPEMIHQDYMERYALRGFVDIDASLVHSIASRMEAEVGHVMKREGLPDGRVRLEIWKTSSYLNVAEFCRLAEEIERQMLSYGVTFHEAREFLNLTKDLEEYKKRATND